MKIKDLIANEFPDALFADGFDDAVIGFEYDNGRVVYDINKMVNILVYNEGMSELDAIEHLEYNVLNAYVGEMTPMYVYVYSSDSFIHLQREL